MGSSTVLGVSPRAIDYYCNIKGRRFQNGDSALDLLRCRHQNYGVLIAKKTYRNFSLNVSRIFQMENRLSQ